MAPRASATLLLALLVGLATLVAEHAHTPWNRALHAGDLGPREESCTLCHRAAVHGLRRSDHASLLQGPDAERSCTVCHAGAEPHAEAARDPLAEPLAPPAVERASCLACHDDVGDPRGAAHPWIPDSTVERLEGLGREAQPEPLLDDVGPTWSAMLLAGYRFVNRSGSAERFDTDLNLDEGVRLFDAEFEASRLDGLLDEVRLEAHDLGDPYARAHLDLRRDGGFELASDYRRRRFQYRASGDYHRVDHREYTVDLGLTLPLDDDLRLILDLSRTRAEGFWLTNRIGNRNVTPQTSIDGVESPRRLDSREAAFGVAGRIGDVGYHVEATWLDEELDERWRFDRGPGDPGGPASEDLTARSTTRGPGARFGLDHDDDEIAFAFDGRYLDLERRSRVQGLETGVDSEPFETETNSRGEAHAETLLLDADLWLRLTDRVAVHGTVGGRWHDEDIRFARSDVTSFPGSGTVVRDDEVRDVDAAQRSRFGDVLLEVEPVDDLRLAGGVGFARDFLRVPDLDPADGDFVEGTTRDHGARAELDWQLAEHWTVRADYADYARAGSLLHELEPNDFEQARADLRHRRERWQAHVGWNHRRTRQDASAHRNAYDALTVDGSWQTESGALDLFASLTLAHSESRTLTTFWFDPDPTPQPTTVGYAGDTWSSAAGFRWRPRDLLSWTTDLSWTDTHGDFDVTSASLRSTAEWEVLDGGRAVVDLLHVHYREQGGLDDYDATLVTLGWRQSFGRRPDSR